MITSVKNASKISPQLSTFHLVFIIGMILDQSPAWKNSYNIQIQEELINMEKISIISSNFPSKNLQ